MSQPASLASSRPLRSRTDLPRLRAAGRAEVFAALGSFDDRGLDAAEFADRALDLLDPQRVPGLAEARAAGELERAVEAVFRACQASVHVPDKPPVSPATVDMADAVLENRFSFYGEVHQLPPGIDWEWNPGTAHWGHDLNRFDYLSPLTQAYLVSGDTRYSRKAVELVLDWIAKCDGAKCFAGTPYVWGSYLNNAIHCQAWCQCLKPLVARGQVAPAKLLRVLKSLHDQLAYLEVVTHGHSGNWPTIGCQGMLDCLAAFPVLRDTDRFVGYCAHAMRRQIAEQVLPDGVQDELTPHYHRVVVNNLVSTIRSLRALGRELDPETLATLRRMLHYVQQTTLPDGSRQVAFNDSDPGTPGDLRRSLEALGLGEMLSPPQQLGPEVFPYAGVAFLRQRQDAGDLYLAFDAGPYGRGHQHEDKLGFWLFAYGRSLLVDPGRHLYDSSAKSYYAYLRSTAAHSTLRLDGQGQHSAARPDTWISQAPLDLGWRCEPGEVRARGTYDLAYGPANRIAVVHRREIVFVRERFWVVFDLATGEGEHDLESRFQFAPGRVALDGCRAHTGFPDANLLLVAAATTPFSESHLESGREDPRGGWYSESYNRIEPAPALSLSVCTGLPWRGATLLWPYRGEALPAVSFEFSGTRARVVDAGLGEVSIGSSLW